MNALVVVDPERVAFHNRIQIEENRRRDRMTPEVCGLVIMAYVESRYNYARSLARGLGARYMVENYFADDSHPSYTELRGFLVGECDARYVDACAAAFSVIAWWNRHQGALGEAEKGWHGRYWRMAERGWL